MLSRRLFFWLVPLLTIGFLVCCASLLYPSLRARYLLYELKDIQLNSTFEDAQRFAKKIGAQELPSPKCTHVECRWYKLTDNALLPQWYRGRGLTFMIVFTAKDSIVTDKGVEYSVGVGSSTPSEAFIGRPRVFVSQTESWFKRQKEKRRELQEMSHEKPTDLVEPSVNKGWEKIWYDENGKITVDYFQVAISPRSKSLLEDWKKYTAFNYSCFWKYKACSYGKDLLPIADPYPPDLLPIADPYPPNPPHYPSDVPSRMFLLSLQNSAASGQVPKWLT